LLEWAEYLEKGGQIMPIGLIEGQDGSIPNPLSNKPFTLSEL
jgi:hypothetical protein